MHAYCVTGPKVRLERLERHDPVPEGQAVVLDVDYCGVCHSDVHFWEGELDTGSGFIPIAKLGIEYPLVLGHEITGTVSALGPEAQGIAVGEKYLVYPWIGCGQCEACNRERDDLCENQRALGVRASGGFGKKIMVPHPRYLLPLGEIDPLWGATLACSGLTAFAAVTDLDLAHPEEPAVVIGAGGLGLAGIAILRARGHRNIVSVDIEDERLAAARDAGATATINSARSKDAASDIREGANGAICSIVDFVNSPQTATLALTLARRGGKIVQVGLFGGQIPLPLISIPSRALTVKGAFVGSLSQFRELVALARSGALGCLPVAERALSEATDVLASLQDGKVIGRIVLSHRS